jgi:hypothetical protein
MGIAAKEIIMQISFNEHSVIFTDDENKSTPLDIFDKIGDLESVRAISKEIHAAGSATKGAVSLLTNILDNPRFDGYKGVTPWNEAIPAEFKGAVRNAEDEYIKPIFFAAHGNPNPHAGVLVDQLSTEQKAERKKFAHVSGLFDNYLKDMRAGGSYAVARGVVLEWFAKGGSRPIAENGKLYSVAALKKLIALEKAANTEAKTDTGIAGQLFAMCQKIEKHEGGDWSFMGDPVTALAALFSLREKFEALQVEQDEQATETFSITGTANAAIAKAQAEPLTGDALMQALKDAEEALV